MGHVTRYLPGTPSWTDLATNDAEGARAFYTGLFGWQGSVDERGYVSYLNEIGEERVYAGGMMQMGEDFPPDLPSHWMVYFAVEDAAAARARVIELGGQAVTDVIEIEPGRFFVATDPQGAAVTLFELSGDTGYASDKLS